MSASIQVLVRVACALAGVVVAAILSRHLGDAGFGYFSTALAIIAIAVALGDLGLNSTAMSRMAAHPRARSETLGALLTAQALLLSVALAPSLAAVWLVLPPGEPRVAGALICLTIPFSLSSAYSAAAQSQLRILVVTVLTALGSAVWLALVIALAASGASLAWVATAFLASSVALAAITVLVCRRHCRPVWAGAGRRAGSLLRAAAPLGFSAVLTTLYYRLDGILLLHIGGAAAAGHYSAAYRFLDTLQILPATLFGVLLPIVSQRIAAGQPIQQLFGLSLRLSAAISLPIAAVGAFVAPETMTLIYSSEFREGARPLAVLLFSFPMIFLGYISSGLLIAAGRRRPLWVVSLIALLASLPVVWILIAAHGATGAALGTVLVEVFVGCTLLAIAARHLALRLPWGGLLRIGVACLVAVFPLALYRPDRLGGLLALVVLAAVIYLACLVLSGAVTRQDLEVLSSRRVVLDA
ncbi:MAG: oligosaccharide flippase family protein [Thermoleophilia bacterium]|nr:oligosaccharide flippase family protein [Thermoleophilia bacterium]